MAIAVPELIVEQHNPAGLEPQDPQGLMVGQQVVARFTVHDSTGKEVDRSEISGEILSIRTRLGQACLGPEDVPSVICLRPDEVTKKAEGAREKVTKTGYASNGEAQYGSRWFLKHAVQRVAFYALRMNEQ